MHRRSKTPQLARQRAIVIHQVVGPAEDDPDEPIIRLEDGTEVVPIWIDRYILKDTEGWAEFVPERNAWQFSADKEEA